MKTKNNANNQLGITLIALVVTIIALLVLAGVTISLITEKNDLFTKANYAGKEYTDSSLIEAERLNSLNNYINSIQQNTIKIIDPNTIQIEEENLPTINPEVIEVGSTWVKTKAVFEGANQENIIAYEYYLNNEIVAISQNDTYEFTNLDPNQSYTINCVAINSDGKYISSRNIEVITEDVILARYLIVEIDDHFAGDYAALNELAIYDINGNLSYTIPDIKSSLCLFNLYISDASLINPML